MQLKHIGMILLCISLVQCKTKKESKKPIATEAPEGMVYIPGGRFMQGAVASDQMAMAHEKPAHPVEVDAFFMSTHEVTNAQYLAFVEATGYITLAERAIDWEELKKQVPPGTPKPHDSILQPGSLLFYSPKQEVENLYDYTQWWEWKIGANWRQPYGPGSDLSGLENFPVVHIAYEDALAYCQWKGERLPTEAEWEFAARAKQENNIYFWGNDPKLLSSHANTWDGLFPVENSEEDGYINKAPVQSFPPNAFGLFDMAGNVWEWTSDWYNTNYYFEAANNGLSDNPKGAAKPFNRTNPLAQEKVIKGGSFLCSASYCASYRISARMANSLDSAMEHLGFRTVKSIP